ncbi:hypothetical protein ITJ57_02380 [Plantibacter sp. VKM Ac-2880]|uniref:hypothetical protein n=1 Tax=Plantibacter sp. VKM Ac-2880 TaxID=2783827 RepID=UPI00188ED8D1|nr:hypothetical protein [Plantibacter sp. VKM Ac-2880]MBF4567601.1 hypothetical protein [Plantibacter sp. VKM Ac-2880]
MTDDERTGAGEPRNLPEQDSALLEWLAMMHPRLARFEDFLTPREVVTDYTRESLVSLEQLIIDRWPDRHAFAQEQDTDFNDGATRYIGETYLRIGGGGWFVNHDPKFLYSGRLCILLDVEMPVPISPLNLITTMLSRRTGNVLTRIWDGQTKKIAERRLAEPGWEPVRAQFPGAIPLSRLGSALTPSVR